MCTYKIKVKSNWNSAFSFIFFAFLKIVNIIRYVLSYAPNMNKKRYSLILIVSIVLYQLLAFTPFYVQAREYSTEQPKVCHWPSKTMSQYFDFQNEIRAALINSKMGERVFTLTTRPGLFSEKVLTLTKITALDLVATNVFSNVRSAISTASTSVVLMMLASVSVLRSNSEGLMILFKDRVIVREYKSMLDIESSLMELAYFLSKSTNLLSPINEDVRKNLEDVIKKYQDLWLLDKNVAIINGSTSTADVILDVGAMNGAMKNFILVWWKLWARWLINYKWCMWWETQLQNCTPVLKFNPEAVNQLRIDYRGLTVFWACNQYASNFKNTITKAAKNNAQNMKVAMQDVKDSIGRLNSALFGRWTWKLWKDRCNISDYQMAQLTAYRWWDWNCEQWLIDWNISVPVDYTSIKKSKAEQKKNDKNQQQQEDEAGRVNSDDTVSEVKKQSTTRKRSETWVTMYGTSTVYDSEFSFALYDDFTSLYFDVMTDYTQSKDNAWSSDLSYELIKINWLIEEIKTVAGETSKLETNLRKVADYQCSETKK